MRRGVLPLFPRLDALRPMNDKRRTHAPFVTLPFVASERCVAEIRPPLTVAARPSALAGPRLVVLDRILLPFDPKQSRLLRATIVGNENQERVVEFTDLLEMGDQAADVLVEPVDDGGEERHLEIHVVFLCVR